MFALHKSWHNRKDARTRRLPTVNGRTWTRRVEWLTDDNLVKLKFWDDAGWYAEYLFASEKDAQTAYDRFRAGQAVCDCVSILGTLPPKHLASRLQSQPKEGGK